MKWTGVDYRHLRWETCNEPRFRHVRLLLFWPLFGLLFAAVERGWTERHYIPVWCPLDDLVPFCEWFLIPYLFWFVFLAGMLVYGFFFDTENFTAMMRFVILTYSITLLIYLVFPTMQELRPVCFPRDNILTRVIAAYYAFDTNTNVCPSLHVIGSFAAMYAGWNSRHFSAKSWRIVFGVLCAAVSLSTVFVKQHSVLDVLLALPLCFAAYPLSFGRREERRALRRRYGADAP